MSASSAMALGFYFGAGFWIAGLVLLVGAKVGEFVKDGAVHLWRRMTR